MSEKKLSFWIQCRDGATAVIKNLTKTLTTFQGIAVGVFRAVGKAASVITAPIRGVANAFIGIIKQGANIAGWASLLQGAFAKVQTAALQVWGAIKEAFRFETLTTQFEMLFGNLEKAKTHMEMIKRLGDTPPFSDTEFAKASKTLHVMTDGILNTERVLILLGDASAATGNDLERLSHAWGRAYAMIRDGAPLSRATMELVNMGVITPKVAAEMNALQQAGESASRIWPLMESSLLKYQGAMERTEKTGDGMIAALSTRWTNSVRQFGEAFTNAAKEGMGALIDKLAILEQSGTITRWADAAVKALTPVKDLLIAIMDNSTRGDTLKAAWDYLKAIFDYGANVIRASVDYAAGMIFAKLDEVTSWREGSKQRARDSASKTESDFESQLENANGALSEATENFKTAARELSEKAKENLANERSATAPGALSGNPDEENARLAEDLMRNEAEQAEKKLAKQAEEQAKKHTEELKEINRKEIEERRRVLEEQMENDRSLLSQQQKAVSDAKAAYAQAAKNANNAWAVFVDPEKAKEQEKEAREKEKAEKNLTRIESRAERTLGEDWRKSERLNRSQRRARDVLNARDEEKAAADKVRQMEDTVILIEEHVAGIAKEYKVLHTMKD